MVSFHLSVAPNGESNLPPVEGPMFMPASLASGPLRRCISDNGDLLPLMGIIVDAPLALPLVAAHEQVIRVGAESVITLDGVLDDSWHLVVVQRGGPKITNHYDNYTCIKALHLVGVRQIFGMANAQLDPQAYLCAIDIETDLGIIDLFGAGQLSGGTASSRCPRLIAAVEASAISAGFEMLPSEMQVALRSPTETENLAAESFGMCYAALDVLDLVEQKLSIATALASVARHAPTTISPLSSCNCQGKCGS